MLRTLRACALALTVSFAACGGGGGTGSPTSAPVVTAPVGVVTSHGSLSTSLLRSSGRVDYPLRIYLPVGYEASATAYPIIYALDSDTWFETMTVILDELGIKAILVAIGRGDRRDFDYQLSGSETFYEFITRELIPFIEPKYRVLRDQRTLVGHSLGGSFVGLALFMDRLGGKYFTNYVMQEGTFDFNSVGFRMEAQEPLLFAASNGQLPIGLVVHGATCCHYAAGSLLYEQIQSRHYQGLKAQKKEYPQSHGGMFIPSFTDAMRFLFP
ncbi:MAG: hypothetical protein CFE43_08720 [Burkholderiales bacterium PBB3]|nr:MAG: hypothetical protein CFE43_08720 [Burkholderiales bacterium PBB3]